MEFEAVLLSTVRITLIICKEPYSDYSLILLSLL